MKRQEMVGVGGWEGKEREVKSKKWGFDSMEQRKLGGAQLQEKVRVRKKRKPQGESKVHQENIKNQKTQITLVVVIQIKK